MPSTQTLMNFSTKAIAMHAKLIRIGFLSLLVVGGVLEVGMNSTSAQEPATPEKAGTTAKKPKGEGSRDPFVPYEPPLVALKKSSMVMTPTIQDRIQQYRAQKMAAINAHVPAPKPTTALLLSELQVVGISRTPRGYAAIVEATPIKLSYVIYPGEKFYDGQLVAIEDTRLVFRHEVVFNDGKRERTVEVKSLRQPSTVDSMTAVKAAEGERKSEERPSGTSPQ